MATGTLTANRVRTIVQTELKPYAAKHDDNDRDIFDRLRNLEDQVKMLLERADDADRRLTGLSDRADNSEGQIATLSDSVKGLLTAAGKSKAPVLLPRARQLDLLSLDPRDSKLDPLALQALAKLGDTMTIKDRAQFIKEIVENGAGANSQKIAKALSQRRVSDMTHHILDLMLPDLMTCSFGNKITFKETKDTIGCVSELLTRLKTDGGPLRMFAKLLVEETSANLKIAMSADQAKHMADHVYASLI